MFQTDIDTDIGLTNFFHPRFVSQLLMSSTSFVGCKGGQGISPTKRTLGCLVSTAINVGAPLLSVRSLFPISYSIVVT